VNTAAVSLLIALAFMVGRYTFTMFSPTKMWLEIMLFFVGWIVIAAFIDATTEIKKEVQPDRSPLEAEVNSFMFLLHFYKNGVFIGQTLAYPALSNPSDQTLRGCVKLLNGCTFGSLPPESVHLRNDIEIPDDAEVRVVQVLIPARCSICEN
jgi:hypothetical protein